MQDTLREAPIGQLLRYLSRNRILRYPEELPGFELPLAYHRALEAQHKDDRSTITGSLAVGKDSWSEKLQIDEELGRISWPSSSSTNDENTSKEELTRDLAPVIHTDGTILVDLYTPEDPASPFNWSNKKRAFISAIICLYT